MSFPRPNTNPKLLVIVVLLDFPGVAWSRPKENHSTEGHGIATKHTGFKLSSIMPVRARVS